MTNKAYRAMLLSMPVVILSPCFKRRATYAAFLGLFLGLAVSAIGPYFPLVFAAKGMIMPNGEIFGGDFSCFYLAGKTARENLSRLYDWEYGFDQRKALLSDPDGKLGRSPFAYPPFLLALFEPLSLLSFQQAYYLWMGLSLLLGLLAILMVANQHPQVNGSSKLLFCLALLGFFPFSIDAIAGGQTSSIAIMIYALMYVLLTKQRDFLAGMVLGIGLYKPPLFLVFAIFVLLERRWAVLKGALLTAFCLCLLSIALWGSSSLSGWVEAGLQYRYGGSVGKGVSLPPDQGVGLISILIRNLHSHGLAWSCFLVVSVVLIALAFWITKPGQNRAAQVVDNAFGLRFGLWLSLSLLLSVQMIKYDVSIIAVAFAAAAGSLWGQKLSLVQLLPALAGAALFLFPPNDTHLASWFVVKPISLALIFWCLSLFAALHLSRQQPVAS